MIRREKALSLLVVLIFASVLTVLRPRSIGASADALIIRPEGDDATVQWKPKGAGAHYVEVDEVIPDGDTTYVYTTSNNAVDEFTLQNSTGQVGNISNVTVYAVAKQETGGNEELYIGVQHTSGSLYWSSAFIPPTTYQEYYYSWSLNPHTGNPWTWSDIDTLRCAIKYAKVGAAKKMRVTQVYVEVTYTPGVHDVAIIGVTPSPTKVNPDRLVNITVIAENQGTETETFNVTTYYDSVPSETQTVTDLAAGANLTLTFGWNTTGVPEGSYTIKAVADTVPGETDTADNTFIDDTVTIIKPTVAVSPASIIGPPPGINDTFTINITISDVVDLYAWQAGMTFDPSVLQAINFTEGPFLKDWAQSFPPPNNETLWTSGAINNTAGVITYHACSLTGDISGASGNGTLGTIAFQVIGYGNSTLHLTDVIFLDSNEIEIPRNVVDGYFQLPQPNQPPVLEPIGPKSVNELELLTFTANASDPDNDPLTFSLGAGAPAGASINSTTGVFTWTPTEAQGPGNYTIRVIVSDGSLTDYEDTTVTVYEVNVAPVLDPVGNKTVDELSLLTFTATASDSDIPTQTLTFFLGAGAPSGASINSSTGVFTWTSTEAQGPGVYTIRIIVSDGALEDYEDVSVTVNEVNVAPVLGTIGPKTVNELELLTFTATASDADLPAQTLTFSLGAGAPAGASINSTTGVFTWTPTEVQGPGNYTIRIIVSDGSLEDYEDITVTVYEVNVAPVLDPIGDKTVNELELLTFTATASDPDIPAQTLTFSLGPGAPSGASITADGVFTWTPTEAQGPGVYTIRIIVSDGSLEDYEDITVTVNEVNSPPVLDPIGPKSVDELSLLTFTATASDPDIPPQTLTFSFGGGAPEGASINATTGVFTWTPTEAQGPDVYTIRVIVSDSALEDYEDVSVTVNKVNVAPVLDPIGSKTVDEETLLTFTATASDADIPAQSLTFSLGLGAPTGASITADGVFSWTPTEVQGPGDFTIRIIVSDGSLEDYEDITVTVYEVNLPPMLDPIGNKTVDELSLLTFTATASDPDIPAQTLTFSLGAGAPSGASINSTTGVFTWTPTEAQGPSVYMIRIIVSDGALEDYEDIWVTVNEVVHDVAVLSVVPSATEAYPTWIVPLNITVIVENQGTTTETFNVTVYYNETAIETRTVTLSAGANTTLVFSWDTTSVPEGSYTIKAEASLVPGETDTEDNIFVDGTVTITKSTVYVSPASITGPPPNITDTFQINITISDVVDLYAWQAGMTFDPSVLQAINFTEGPFLKDWAQSFPPPNNETLWTSGTINNTAGIITYHACSLTGPIPGASGNGTLGTITFKVKNYGNSTLHLTDVILLNSTLIEIPRNVLDGYFELPLPLQPPVASFTYTPDVLVVGEPVTFDASGSYDPDGYILSYRWDFGDGNVTTVTDPIVYHVYATIGNYTVTLNVTDDDGLSDVDSKILNVRGLVYDVAVVSVTPSVTEVYSGQVLNVTVVVRNEGTTTETFNVTLYSAQALGWQLVEADGRVAWYSNGTNLGDFLLSTSVTIPIENPVLTFDTKYDIEHYWDFGFVQVSTDGGVTWASLENPYTTYVHDPNAHPDIIANLPGFSGTSSGWPGWMTMMFNLTDYAGETVLLGFRYMTDEAGLLEGWYVDNVMIGNVSISDGAFEKFNPFATAIQTITVSSLAPGANATLTFSWNTTDWYMGNYNLIVVAGAVPGEVDIMDNTSLDSSVLVTYNADINGDGIVDIFDAILLSTSFGAEEGSPNWNPDADINGDGRVDIYDAIILASYFGKTIH